MSWGKIAKYCVTCFIVIFMLLLWFGTKTTTYLSYACIHSFQACLEHLFRINQMLPHKTYINKFSMIKIMLNKRF